MNFREDRDRSHSHKQAYLDGIERLIAQRQQRAEGLRGEYSRRIFDEPERYRAEFRKMLGWPLTGCEPAPPPAATVELLSQEAEYSIWRMTFEVIEGMHMSGLLFRMHGDAPRPMVIVQHGGGGTPEFMSGLYGDTVNYNHMLDHVIRRGVHAFAPQLLLWSADYGVPYDRRAIDARLKRLGSSITALEVYGITRIIDYFQAQDFVTAFGMVGLSYGGFYTLYTAAADTRIRSAISCSFFSRRDAYPWSDWTWQRSAEMFDDAEIACLVHPRRLCLEMGNRDELFAAEHSEISFARVKEMCRDVGTDWVELIVFDGLHEFLTDPAPMERLIRDLR